MARKRAAKQEQPQETQEAETETAVQPKSGNGSMTKTDAVRAALAEGFDQPEEGIAFIKQRFDIDMTRPQFSTNKSLIRKRDGEKGGKKPGRPAKRAAPDAAASVPASSGNGPSGLAIQVDAIKTLVDTRRTLAAIITGIKDRQAALDNPQEFASQAARVIREKAIQQLVDGIQYEKDGTWYDMSEWVETEETVSERLVPVENSIYDQIVVQSDVERKFAEKLTKRKDVKQFVKLPDWFKVATPVGQYNPDWALVMEKPDDEEELLYLVRETKSTTAADELRGTENQKIHCGEKHFVGGLDVDFRVVTNADELP